MPLGSFPTLKRGLKHGRGLHSGVHASQKVLKIIRWGIGKKIRISIYYFLCASFIMCRNTWFINICTYVFIYNGYVCAQNTLSKGCSEKKKFRYRWIFVIWSWVPAQLMAYYVSPPKWFVIISNSICKKKAIIIFSLEAQPVSLILFLLMASAAFSQSPSLETLSHLLFASPFIPVSAIAFPCFLLSVSTATTFSQAHLITFTIKV